MTKKVIKKKIGRLSAKSHTIGCKECGTPTICAAEADWVICPICVASMSVLVVKGRAKNPRKKKTIKKKGKK